MTSLRDDNFQTPNTCWDGVEPELSIARISSPIGEFRLVACSKGLHDFSLVEVAEEFNLGTRVECLSEEKGLEPVVNTVEWLRAYFDRREDVLLPKMCLLDQNKAQFSLNVLRFIRDEVRFGHAMSYGEVGERCGRANAARAVGQAMRRNPIMLLIPCHRVVAKGGKLGGFAGKRALHDLKQWLLEFEKKI